MIAGIVGSVHEKANAAGGEETVKVVTIGALGSEIGRVRVMEKVTGVEVPGAENPMLSDNGSRRAKEIDRGIPLGKATPRLRWISDFYRIAINLGRWCGKCTVR